MLLLLLFHAVVGTGVLAAGGRVGRRWGVGLGVLPVAATLVWLLIRLPDVVGGRVLTERVAWISDLSLAVELRLDGFAALMVLLVSGIGVQVFGYAASYLSDDTPNVGRLIGLLTLFSGAMARLDRSGADTYRLNEIVDSLPEAVR